MKKIVIILLLASTAMADGAKTRLGGPNLDAELHHEWQTYVKDQAFPSLPHSSKLPKEPSEPDRAKRQRYIMYLDMRRLNSRMEDHAKYKGYYQMQYASKEAGNYIVAVHEKFKECFVNAAKKFDEMQAVVFQEESYEADATRVHAIVVEKPHQCRGDFPASGGKLKKTK